MIRQLFSSTSRTWLIILAVLGCFGLLYAGIVIYGVVRFATQFGPDGLGNLSKFTSESSRTGKFDISFPSDWYFFDTPDGNHGDREVVAVIGGSYSDPGLVIAKHSFPEQRLEQVVEWGKTRTERSDQYEEIGISDTSILGTPEKIREYRFLGTSGFVIAITFIAWIGMF